MFELNTNLFIEEKQNINYIVCFRCDLEEGEEVIGLYYSMDGFVCCKCKKKYTDKIGRIVYNQKREYLKRRLI